MCGRTSCTLSPEVICKACSFAPTNERGLVTPQWRDHPGIYVYSPSTNMAPSIFSPVILKTKSLSSKRDVHGNNKPNGDYIIQPMMWGLIPPFFKGDCPKSHGLKTNNCRIEDVIEKKSYFPSLRDGRRCTVVVDGFYEWQATKGSKNKQPYFIHAPQPNGVEIWNKETWCSDDDWTTTEGWKGVKPLKMAGLYSHWRSSQGEEVYSYTVLTMEAGSKFSSIHHRMPAILETQEEVEKWLNERDYNTALANLAREPVLEWYPVSSRVNNSRNQDNDLTTPVHLQSKPPTASNKLMMSWLRKGKSGTAQKVTLNSQERKVLPRATDKKEASGDGLLKWLKKESAL